MKTFYRYVLQLTSLYVYLYSTFIVVICMGGSVSSRCDWLEATSLRVIAWRRDLILHEQGA